MTRPGSPVAPARALLHPLWLASLALLVLNDHVLKGSGLVPGWLTGKLSDVAGLVVAPALLAVLLRVRSRRGLFAAHAAVGLVYSALELSPALTAIWRIPFDAIGIGWTSYRDPTDLLALPALAIAWWIAARAPSAAPGPRLAERAVLAAGLAACMATSAPQPTVTVQCTDCDGDGWAPPLDCDDNNPSVNPGQGNCFEIPVEDSCDDGIDNDFDGLTDCDDPDCATVCADVNALCAAVPMAGELLVGSTLGKSSDMEGSCVGADAPEAVFWFDPPTPRGILTIDLPPGHGAYVRTECNDPWSEIACAPPVEGDGGTLELEIDSGPVYIVLDAATPFDAADFSAATTYAPIECGDGVLSPGEECDDGNSFAGDGCSPLCESELPFVCASLPVLTLGQTEGEVGWYPASLFEGSCGGGVGRELGYVFVPPSDGVLSLSLAGGGDLLLHARDDCLDDQTEIACVDLAPAGGTETLDIPAAAGSPITLFVDATDVPDAPIPFVLTAGFAP